LVEAIQKDLELRYPDMRFVEEGHRAFVRGSFPIVHDGRVLDRYQVEIEFLPDYPHSLPKVREVQGRIPHILDRHVFPLSGTACLFVEEDWLLTISEGTDPSFLEFLDGPVRNFFLGQALVEAGEKWPFGERSHGIKGLLEVYGEWFGTVDQVVILRHLEYLSKENIKGHWECPCGSGQTLRKCHIKEVRDLKVRISSRVAKSALARLKYAQRLRDESQTKPLAST